MTKKVIIRKPFINKRTQQMSVTIPKRELKRQIDSIKPSLKYSDELFVKISLFRKRKR